MWVELPVKVAAVVWMIDMTERSLCLMVLGIVAAGRNFEVPAASVALRRGLVVVQQSFGKWVAAQERCDSVTGAAAAAVAAVVAAAAAVAVVVVESEPAAEN